MSSPSSKSNRRTVPSTVRRSILRRTVVALYVFLLIVLTMAPNPQPPAQLVNLIPFKSIEAGIQRGGWLLNVNVLGNIVAFVPLGLLLPSIGRWRGFPSVFWASLLLSVTIEALQWLFALRVADIDDVILNVLGASAGYGLHRLLAKPEDVVNP